VIALCVAGALALRALLLPLDARLAAVRMSRGARRRAGLALGAAVLLALFLALVPAGGARFIGDQYDGFFTGSADTGSADLRARLASASNNGRLDHWRVALDAFERAPLRGHGAGTYAALWARGRHIPLKAEDGATRSTSRRSAS
jgi:O-antigen ligase